MNVRYDTHIDVGLSGVGDKEADPGSDPGSNNSISFFFI